MSFFSKPLQLKEVVINCQITLEFEETSEFGTNSFMIENALSMLLLDLIFDSD